MRIRYLIRFSLLATGFALTTAGLLGWQQVSFDLVDFWANIWPLSGALKMHPVYLIVMGMSLIPPSLWEIFLLEQQNNAN
ncbi:MAG: hypothetical protein ACI9ON_002068 [Limisphaerales bacterium]|jgi:hypothetical protein